jgi:hypothetical protein
LSWGRQRQLMHPMFYLSNSRVHSWVHSLTWIANCCWVTGYNLTQKRSTIKYSLIF